MKLKQYTAQPNTRQQLHSLSVTQILGLISQSHNQALFSHDLIIKRVKYAQTMVLIKQKMLKYVVIFPTSKLHFHWGNYKM